MIIYQFTLNGVGGEQLVASFTMVPQMMAEQIAGNGALLLFLALLGALTVVIATAESTWALSAMRARDTASSAEPSAGMRPSASA